MVLWVFPHVSPRRQGRSCDVIGAARAGSLVGWGGHASMVTWLLCLDNIVGLSSLLSVFEHM